MNLYWSWRQGEIEFKSLLFIPGMAPFNSEDMLSGKTKNIRLYVKRVFISDEFDGELVCFQNLVGHHIIYCLLVTLWRVFQWTFSCSLIYCYFLSPLSRKLVDVSIVILQHLLWLEFWNDVAVSTIFGIRERCCRFQRFASECVSWNSSREPHRKYFFSYLPSYQSATKS